MTTEGRRRSRRRNTAETQDPQRLLLEEIRTTLRSPVVPLLIHRLAAGFPAYLERAWRELKPNLLSRAFEHRAEELRAAALQAAAEASGLAPGAFREALRRRMLFASVVDEIARAVDVAFLLEPKVLLVATALDLALDNEPVGAAADLGPEEREALPAPPATEAGEFALLGDAEAPARVLRLWDDLVRTLELPGVTEAFRAFGRWPDFLEVVWATAKPLVRGGGVDRIGALAEDGARRLPFRVTVGPVVVAQLGYAPAQATELARLARQFRRRLPAAVFTVALAKLGLDAAGLARTQAAPLPA
ncbi:MAG TPA: halocarboxylic acid dehydrogenase DehI family protein [Thermodesulfobacteriota bacterium]|nr:halocarboxylic acid dehydrogenase DehI family protein [Thermodesulfobacteriota bacterium]